MSTEINPIFDREKGTLLLNVKKEGTLADSLKDHAFKYGFLMKDEYHITIVGFSEGKKLLEKKEFFNDIEKLIKSTLWSYKFTDQIFYVKKDYSKKDGGVEHRESYIQIAEVESIEEFIKKLNTLTGLFIEIPFAHVTLFFKSSDPETNNGIGISSLEEFNKLNPQKIHNYSAIALPTRPQTDTIIATFLLKTFGGKIFPGIESARCQIMSTLAKGENEEILAERGTLLLDVGGGKFDHHNKTIKTTSSDLVADFLGVSDDPSITKLIEVARRCDFFGKGTISEDPLDRAFGLAGLVSSFNKVYVSEPAKVVEAFLPIIEAHYREEVRRKIDMPLEVEEKIKSGKADIFEVRQRDKKLKVIIIESDNPSLPGFLRAHVGGSYDVVAQVRETGHINILTRPAKRIDLRALIALIRAEELMLSGFKEDFDMSSLAKTGRLDHVPEWYYDPATNSIQNGGINPTGTNATKIEHFSLRKILEVGLSEQIWSPVRR